MKRLVGLVLLLSTLLLADKTAWVEGVDEAFAQATKEHKMVMLFVESSHCRWCKRMKERTLDDMLVQQKLSGYVAVKVQRSDRELLASFPQIQGVPTIFLMTPQREIIESVIGYFNVEDFLSYLDDVEKEMH